MATNTVSTGILSITEWLYLFNDRLAAYLEYIQGLKHNHTLIMPEGKYHGGFIIDGQLYTLTSIAWKQTKYDFKQGDITVSEHLYDATSI
jgi:hypothetical protein